MVSSLSGCAGRLGAVGARHASGGLALRPVSVLPRTVGCALAVHVPAGIALGGLKLFLEAMLTPLVVGRRVHAAVESVRARRPLRRVLIKASGRIYAVRVEDIDYIEVAGHYVELHTGATTHLLRDTIGSMEGRLDSSRFVRIHRSVMVNIDRIRELRPAFHGEFVVSLHTGHQLRCRRTYAERLTKAMGS